MKHTRKENVTARGKCGVSDRDTDVFPSLFLRDFECRENIKERNYERKRRRRLNMCIAQYDCNGYFCLLICVLHKCSACITCKHVGNGKNMFTFVEFPL
jgi:hypothetical protein